jgi:arsenate reductase (thioredoxin)
MLRACSRGRAAGLGLLLARLISAMAGPHMAEPYNVLFLCTGNSARSVLAEAILNRVGAGKFRSFSAGSRPKGQVHPETIRLLQSLGYDTAGFRSKSWDEFTAPGAPQFDFVFTVCDNAAAESCPLWPGQPMTAHWGVPDPAEATGSAAEIALAFKEAYRMLNQRIGIFTSLPLRSLDKLALQRKLKEIGGVGNAVEPT